MGLLGLRKQKPVHRGKKEKSPWKRVAFGLLTALLVGSVLYGIWYVTHRPSLTIDSIRVYGGETISHEKIQKRAEQLLEGNYIFVIPKRFTYLYPEEDIVGEIESLDRVKSVVIEKPSRRELSITITEYIPHALWCDSLDEAAACLFVDAEGVAFSAAPHLTGGTFLRYIIEGEILQRGGVIHDERLFAAAEEFVSAVEQQHNMRVFAVTRTTDGDIRYHIAGGGEIIVDPRMNTQETFDNLESILRSEEFQHIAPGNFAYIDLRFGDKVYVNENVGTAEEEVPATEEEIVFEE